MITPAGFLLIVTGIGSPQGRVLDQGEFIVTRHGTTIGREQFTVRRNRSREGATGFLIEARATYTNEPPGVELHPVVELGPDSLPVAAQLDVTGESSNRFILTFGPRRVILRTGSQQREGAREFPPAERPLVVDDSVFSLYAVLPGTTPGPIQLFYPRIGRRVQGSLRSGGYTDRAGDRARPLRHLIVDSGRGESHLWYDETGRLMRVELPALGLVATRSGNR